MSSETRHCCVCGMPLLPRRAYAVRASIYSTRKNRIYLARPKQMRQVYCWADANRKRHENTMAARAAKA